MPIMRFSNNAVATTATLLRDSPDWDTYPEDEALANQNYLGFEITESDNPDLFYYFSGERDADSVQPLTLTHPTLPGVHEIVYLTGRDGRRFTVTRGDEFTPVQAWPAGTKVSANVTAGMLESLLQADGSVAVLNSNGSIVLGAGEDRSDDAAPASGTSSFLFRTRAKVDRVVQMGAYPVIHAHLAEKVSNYGGRGGDQDLALAHEATGALSHVDIGEPRVWDSPRSYWQGAVIVPSTPGGYQYWLNSNPNSGMEWYTFNEEPAFSNDGSNTPIYEGEGEEAKFLGNWEAQVMPVQQVSYFRFRAMVTEVGFIGRVDGTLTQVPSISVGTEDNPTLFLNSVPLSQLTTDGELSVHRAAIAAGGHLVMGLKFTLNQAGVGARITGRFYWRAIFYSEE